MPFNIGFGELVVILIIALVIFGPGKLPTVGSAIGKSFKEFKKALNDVTSNDSNEKVLENNKESESEQKK
jgi:sec-independent protein translocase protein TatA